MAQQIQTLFIDDIDGSEAEGTVAFGLDGTEYEIDLNPEHKAELLEILKRYVAVGRRAASSSRQAARGGRGGGRSSRATDKPESILVRAWAREQGMKINDRGRVPDEVNFAYENRNNPTQAARVSEIVAKYKPSEPEVEASPAPVEGYDDLTFASVRARLRYWDEPTLNALIKYETREDFLKILRARLGKLTAASN